MLARAWKDRMSGLTRLAAGLDAWWAASLISRWLAGLGGALVAASVASVPGRVIWWDRGLSAALAESHTRRVAAGRWWQSLTQGMGRRSEAVLEGSLVARVWRSLVGLVTGEAGRGSAAIGLLRWYYRAEESGPAENRRAVARGAQELWQDWTLLALHLLIWLLPVVNATQLLLLAFAVSGLMVVRVLTGERLRGSTLLVPLAAYLGISALSTVSSVRPAGSLRDMAIVVASAGVFCALANVRTRQAWYGLLASLAGVATLVSLLGLYQYISGVAVISKHWFDPKTNPGLTTRVFSTFGNPNILAEYLILVIPAVVGLFWSEKNALRQMLFAAMVGITGLALVLTFSRGAWLGMALAATVFLIIMEPRILFLVPIGLIGGYFFLPGVIHARLASIVNLSDASNAYRLNIWIATLRMIRDYWVTGVGLGYRSFMWVYQEYRIKAQVAWHSHNQYLEQFVEMGIVGLLIFVWLMVRVMTVGGRALRHHGAAGSRARAVVAGAVASVAGVLFAGLFENIFYLPTVILSFWVIAGLAAGATGTAESDDGAPEAAIVGAPGQP